MADASFLEGEQSYGQFRDGFESYSCGKSKTKPSLDEVKQQISIDTMPILVEDTSLSADGDFHGSSDQDFYSVSLLPEDGNSPQCGSSLALVSIKVPNSSKNDVSITGRSVEMKNEEGHSSCIIDIDAETEPLTHPGYNEEVLESFKNESTVNKTLRRQASLKVGGRLMKLIMNLSPSKGKPATERVCDVPNNRCRKYKRSSSFNSRKIALLFSVLSSVGTLVLIYLTLRVRQKSADGFVLIS